MHRGDIVSDGKDTEVISATLDPGWRIRFRKQLLRRGKDVILSIGFNGDRAANAGVVMGSPWCKQKEETVLVSLFEYRLSLCLLKRRQGNRIRRP